jgi:hypothetical protein
MGILNKAITPAANEVSGVGGFAPPKGYSVTSVSICRIFGEIARQRFAKRKF